MRGSRVLVLGGSGHVGQALVREMLDRGAEVTATSRSADAPGLRALDVRTVVGDIEDPGQLDAWVQGQDVVVDAAAPYPLHPLTGPWILSVVDKARRRTARLLDAVESSGACLAFISTFTTLPRHDDAVGAVEAWWRRGAHPYFAVKQAMETMVLEAARDGLPIVVVNPTTCLGPWNARRDLTFTAAVLASAVPFTIAEWINVVDVRDVAAAVRVAVEARAYGEPLVVSGHDVRVDDLTRRICALAGIAPPRLAAPTWVVGSIAAWSEIAWASVGVRTPFPSLTVLLAREGYPMGRPLFERRFGLSVRPLEETLRDTVEWQLDAAEEP